MRSVFELSDQNIISDEASSAVSTSLWMTKLLQHSRNPQNLLTYLVLTAWMKFMGVAAHLPSITVG
jgi:hypothetical protein